MAHIQKCPNCGGDVLDGYCYACGIEVAPQEEQSGGYPHIQTDFAEPPPQTDRPNIKVEDIVYEKPIEEDFYTKYNKMSFGDKMGKYWWFVLLSLLLPTFWLVPLFIVIGNLFFYKHEKLKFIAELALLALVGVILLG
ncbi:MAG: hypothetical protein LBM41_00940 [Ruminococcus sp.]|jgi:hypothetical protein|nr:hypothetical protein [Ruminococcus sp.]